jgi:large subunit ribosomal protein L10
MAKIGKICKDYMVKELSDTLKNKTSIVVTECTGLSVSELSKLRASLKPVKASYIIIKNSLGKIVLKNTDYEPLNAYIDGTIGLAVGGDDPISTSRTLMKFSKDSGKLKVKGGWLDGKFVNEEEIKAISVLPPKEVLLARAFGGMKAPITGFANVLQGTIRKFVYAINAVKNKKEGGSD